MEFRTEAPGSQKDDSGGLDGFLDNYITSLKSSDAAKEQLVALVQQNDVPPALVAPLFDANPDEFQAYMQKLQQKQAQAEAQQKAQQSTQDMSQETEVKVEKQVPTSDEIVGIVDDIIDVKGEDVTLGELKEFAEKNPDTVDSLIDMQF